MGDSARWRNLWLLWSILLETHVLDSVLLDHHNLHMYGGKDGLHCQSTHHLEWTKGPWIWNGCMFWQVVAICSLGLAPLINPGQGLHGATTPMVSLRTVLGCSKFGLIRSSIGPQYGFSKGAGQKTSFLAGTLRPPHHHLTPCEHLPLVVKYGGWACLCHDHVDNCYLPIYNIYLYSSWISC